MLDRSGEAVRGAVSWRVCAAGARAKVTGASVSAGERGKCLVFSSGECRMQSIPFCSGQRMEHPCPIRRAEAERLAGSLHPPVCKPHSLWGNCLSIRLINAVVEKAPVHGGEYLLLICMARYAADDGTRVFPSVGTLARDTRQEERSVHRQLRSLEEKGLIVRVGVSRHSTVNYRIAIEKLSTGDDLQTPSPVALESVAPDIQAFTPVRRTPDSSSNTSSNSSKTVEENQRQRTVKGSEALAAISQYLPKFRSSFTEKQ